MEHEDQRTIDLLEYMVGEGYIRKYEVEGRTYYEIAGRRSGSAVDLQERHQLTDSEDLSR